MKVELAREIVMAHGWNSTAYQILNPGIDLWFSADRRAVVGFTRRSGTLVVAGAPVCAWDALASVCNEFETFARGQHRRVCYVCAEERLRSAIAGSAKHAYVALGAQPAWNPGTWPSVVERRPSLRAQLHRARNKGVEVEALGVGHASDADLRGVLREWVEGRRLPPLHFLVEPDVLDGVMADRMLFAARRGGEAVAILVASPIVARKGYLVELLARTSKAPNGTSELLIDAAMRTFAHDGCEYATLGLVALAHAADDEIRANPRWLRMMMMFARAHANRFYNFEGLEHFRVKMEPERWETVYAVSNEPRFSMRSLYAMGAAFSGIPPWAAVGLGMAKAIGEEVGQISNLRRIFKPPARQYRKPE